MKILTVDAKGKRDIARMTRAVDPIAGDRTSDRSIDCQCAKCRAKPRSGLTIADLERLMVGPCGRPPRTVAEMNEYNRQFYGKERA
jgi:hypothetical protein